MNSLYISIHRNRFGADYPSKNNNGCMATNKILVCEGRLRRIQRNLPPALKSELCPECFSNLGKANTAQWISLCGPAGRHVTYITVCAAFGEKFLL
jgi:hypothetical protein